MAKPSPLRSAQADTRSVCGKLLRKGQSVTVLPSALGEREKTMIARGQIYPRSSNKPGYIQLVVK
jgi:hypothetical protein